MSIEQILDQIFLVSSIFFIKIYRVKNVVSYSNIAKICSAKYQCISSIFLCYNRHYQRVCNYILFKKSIPWSCD